MIAVEKQPKNQKKLSTELFDDVPVLQRKWLAAVRPGEGLPRYEEVSRTGRYVQKWLDDERWDIPLSALTPDCATALGEAAANAIRNSRPYLAVAHCVRDGMVRTYDVCWRCRRHRAGAVRWSASM